METIVTEIYSVEKCNDNPMWLWVFGENTVQQHRKTPGGGQAVIRGCFNSYGFRTLQAIGLPWRDIDFERNVAMIEADIQSIKDKAITFEKVVFPKYGLGTGRAFMTTHCPKTFLYMSTRLLQEFGFNNIAYLKPPMF